RPGMILFRADRRPCLAEPRHAGPREPRDPLRVGALAEREHVEPLRPGLQRVRVLERAVHEEVACPDLVPDGVALALPLDRDARATEHVEDLFLGALEMKRRRPHARIDLDALEPHHARVAAREAPPGARDVPPLPTPGPRVVPVLDHGPIMS